MGTAVDECVDLDRYPVLDPDGAALAAIVDGARAQLRDTGAVELASFLTPSGIAALASDADVLAGRAHHSSGEGTAYLEFPDFSLPEDHPRLTWGHYAVGAVPYDLMPGTSLLKQLYGWEPLRSLVEAVLDRGPVHRYADPFGALNLAVMHEGDELQWHFDQTDFVVSLAIQTTVQRPGLLVSFKAGRRAMAERRLGVKALLPGLPPESESELPGRLPLPTPPPRSWSRLTGRSIWGIGILETPKPSV